MRAQLKVGLDVCETKRDLNGARNLRKLLDLDDRELVRAWQLLTSKSGPDSISPRRRGKSRKTVALAGTILDIFETFEGSMSTRQVFYQCVSRGAVPYNPKEATRVQRLVVEMRRDGQIPYDRVVDRTRGKHQRPGWDGVEELLDAGAAQYRRDLWIDQKTIVMVACEKQALEGIFAEVVDEYGASLWTLRGYASVSFAFEWATEIKRLNRRGKRVVIAYFGDHDPTGIDIERSTQDEMRGHGAEFEWQRRGLLETDFERYDLVNLGVKKTDTRSRKYLERYGNRAAELDALRPDVLRARIETAISAHIDTDAWDRLERTEATERESLKLIAGNWEAAVQAVQP